MIQYLNSTICTTRIARVTVTTLITFSCLLFALAANCSSAVIDKVIAVVNDDIITQSELNDEGADVFFKIEKTLPPEQQEAARIDVSKKLLDRLVEKRLIEQTAQRTNTSVSMEEVDAAYLEKLSSKNVDREEYETRLKESGVSLQNIKRQLQLQLLKRKLVQRFVASRLVVTDEMVLDHYKGEYATKAAGGLHLLQIGFTWDTSLTGEELKEAKKEAYSLASKIRKKSQGSADFRKLARNESQLSSASKGGDLGIFQKEELSTTIKEAVSDLAPGGISRIIETSSSYQFFKRASQTIKNQDIPAPTQTAKKDIRKQIYEKKFNEEYKEWIKEVKKQAYIEIL